MADRQTGWERVERVPEAGFLGPRPRMSTANPLHHRAVSLRRPKPRAEHKQPVHGWEGWEGWARCLADWLWHATGGGCGW